MDVTDYMEKVNRQLSNKEHYCQLSKHQARASNETVNHVIEKFRLDSIFSLK